MPDETDMKLLRRIVGPELFFRVLDLFAGSRVYFPKSILRARRVAQILAMSEPVDRIAVKFGISRRRVRQIRAGQMEFTF